MNSVKYCLIKQLPHTQAHPRWTRCGLLALVCLLGVSCLSAGAQDWPEWGGTPARNMYSPAKGLPDHFIKGKNSDIKFKSGTDEVDTSNVENLKWVAKIGSQSYGNVTVANG